MRPYSHAGQYEDMPTEEINRRVEELHLHSITFLRSPPPAHDPIFTPLFVSLGITGTIAGTGVTWAAALSGIATTAMIAGMQELRP